MNVITQLATKMDGILLDTMAKRAAANPNFLVTTINTDITYEELGGNFIDTFLGVIQWAGVFTVISSIIVILYAHSNGDSATQQKGTVSFLTGCIAFGLRSVLKVIGILN